MKWCAEGYEDVEPTMTFSWLAESVEAWAIQQVSQMLGALKIRDAQLKDIINLLGGALLHAKMSNISMNIKQAEQMRATFAVTVAFDKDGTIRAKIERRESEGGIVAATESDMNRILHSMNLTRGN